MTATVIQRHEAVALLERTDSFNGGRGVGSPMGGPESEPRPLRLVLDLMDRCYEFHLRETSTAGAMILEMLHDGGWLSYYVHVGEKREASWP